MKKYLTLLLAAGLALVSGCKEKEPQVVPAPPSATFNIEGDSVEAKLDVPVLFAADVDCPCGYLCGWTVGDQVISNIAQVTYVFTQKGAFEVSFYAENELGRVDKTYAVNVTGEALVVEYSVEPTADPIDVTVGESMGICVTVLSGDKSTQHQWTVDDKVVSADAELEYTFTTLGAHSVAYYGVNADGESTSGQWAVNVVDLPLEIEFVPGGSTVAGSIFKEIVVKANVKHGMTGIQHKWSVGGVVLGTEAVFKHKFETVGTYTLVYEASNAAGESMSRQWTVRIVDYLAYDDFESAAMGISKYYIGNNPSGVNAIDIVENPYKTAANPSDKVLLSAASRITWSSSGYFKFKIDTYPDGTAIPASERAEFSKIRVKVYLGAAEYYPRLQEDMYSTKALPVEINGQPFDRANASEQAWKALIKTNDWNTLVYDLKSGFDSRITDLGKVNQVQFRLTVDITNKNQPFPYTDVYVDDIEFVK